MTNAPQTLLSLAKADLTPSRLAESALILVDCQNEYIDGLLALRGVQPALAEARSLLERARTAGTPVFHIAHLGGAGGPFDPDGHSGAIADAVAPHDGEAVIRKRLPNAFVGTDLHERVKATGRTDLIVCGFMTHMCVSSTVRAALDLGYRNTVVAAACATRDLPDSLGGVVDAETLHRTALAALGDRFAVIAPDAAAIPA
jgi:nicotinamidase-related amidase